jgi:hypothetical protein
VRSDRAVLKLDHEFMTPSFDLQHTDGPPIGSAHSQHAHVHAAAAANWSHHAWCDPWVQVPTMSAVGHRDPPDPASSPTEPRPSTAAYGAARSAPGRLGLLEYVPVRMQSRASERLEPARVSSSPAVFLDPCEETGRHTNAMARPRLRFFFLLLPRRDCA